MRIKHIAIEGYRALESVKLDPESLAVLIGANGCGKSTFLDVFALLAEAMGEGLSKGIVARGGFARMLTLGKTETLRVVLDGDDVKWPSGQGATPLRYEIELRQSGTGYEVVAEHLTQVRDPAKPPFPYLERWQGHVSFFDPKANKLVPADWNVLPQDLALREALRTFEVATAFRSALSGTRVYAPIALDTRSVLRVAQTLQPNVTFPSPTGEDLLSALYRMRIEDESSYQQLVDHLSVGFPGFEKLEFPPVGGGQVALAWYGEHLRGPLFGHELSTGTLRFLHLAAMLLSSELPPLLVLDEPEVSFHPELLRLLADLLLDASSRTQLVVATHSPALLRWLKPEQVIVVDRSEHGSVFRKGDSLNLEHWLKDYTLDELWQMKVLGAQP